MERLRCQAAFTLIEVLIATTLMAVMMTLVLGSLRVSIRSWDEGDSRMERMSRMLIAQQFLRGSLTGALPLMRNPSKAPPVNLTDANRNPLMFQGGRDWVEYVATLPPLVKGGLYTFRLYLTGGSENRELRVTLRPISPAGGEGGEPIDDVTLVENVDFMKVRYFKKGQNAGLSAPEWLDEWHQELMPDLIKIDIALHDEPPWPSLLIEPKIEVRR